MRTSIVLFIAYFSLAAFAELAHANDQRRDGNWWRGEDRESHLDYVTGLTDGMSLGRDFSVWPYLKSKNTNEQKSAHQANSAFDIYWDKYLAGTTIFQLVDGLDSFYEDYRNRSITLSAAVWLVVNGIAGTPEKELNKMIELHRKNYK